MTLETEIQRIIDERESEATALRTENRQRELKRKAAISDRIDYYLNWLGITGDYGSLPIKIEVLLETVWKSNGGDRLDFPIRVTEEGGKRNTLWVRVKELGGFNAEGEYVWSEDQGVSIGLVEDYLSTPEGARVKLATLIVDGLVPKQAKEPKEDREPKQPRGGKDV